MRLNHSILHHRRFKSLGNLRGHSFIHGQATPRIIVASHLRSMHTTILRVDPRNIGHLQSKNADKHVIDDWVLELDNGSQDAEYLSQAAKSLQTSDIPVAFPTETVYGLGADATRSSAVRGIYQAKQRPSDNPLIVHFASLSQLRQTLRPLQDPNTADDALFSSAEAIPSIYKPLIDKFWPGPLTIILPNPSNSILAPEVTAGLDTFGARIPRSLLALALIKLADRPIAAPSANASTKPSPTAAEHVHEDLNGRIEYILDGGPCDVGVESTVVNGLADPPAILRPGGISIEQLRICSGWENVRVAYKDAAEQGNAPRAPGMKYRHYSPKAPVVLGEVGCATPSAEQIGSFTKIGVVRTRQWKAFGTVVDKGMTNGDCQESFVAAPQRIVDSLADGTTTLVSKGQSTLQSLSSLLAILDKPVPAAVRYTLANQVIYDIGLGSETEDIARGLFSALRELDRTGVEVIFVEAIAEEKGDLAAAVMNRLRKAAEKSIGG